MNPHLTISYITARKDNRVEWFLDSLRNQGGFGPDISVIVVDFWGSTIETVQEKERQYPESFIKVIRPKPSPWQGEHRLTREDFFAAANARNSALCHAKDGHIVYLDDISVLLPSWMDAVRRSIAGNYIALGAYKKVKDLIVENGEVKSFTPFLAGVDSRWNFGSDTEAVPCNGDILYGCSVAMPVEALLTINGWDERADNTGMGGEDYVTGMILTRNGYHLKYDRRMLTYESEELHHIEKPMKRVIEKIDGREDSSWELLRMARDPGAKTAPNYFSEGGIRALRQHILSGGEFPVTRIPEHSWYSKKHLSEL